MHDDTAHALSDCGTLWELIERRAALSPDTPALIQAAADPAGQPSAGSRRGC